MKTTEPGLQGRGALVRAVADRHRRLLLPPRQLATHDVPAALRCRGLASGAGSDAGSCQPSRHGREGDVGWLTRGWQPSLPALLSFCASSTEEPRYPRVKLMMP